MMTEQSDEDWDDLTTTAGGMVVGGWERLRMHGVTQGTWVLGRRPVSQSLVLVFGARNPYEAVPFVEIEQDDIESVHKVKGGLNLAVELRTVTSGTYAAVGPRKRIKTIMRQLGFEL